MWQGLSQNAILKEYSECKSKLFLLGNIMLQISSIELKLNWTWNVDLCYHAILCNGHVQWILNSTIFIAGSLGSPAEGMKTSDLGLDRCTNSTPHRPLLLHGWLITTMFWEGITIAKLSTCDTGISSCKE